MSFGLVFTYVMAYGGSAVALVNPYVGFLIYVCFAILRPGPGLWFWSVPDGNYSKILAISLLIGWAIRGGGNWRLGPAKLPVLALVAYLGWHLLSAIPAVNQTTAWEWVEKQSKIVLVVVVGATMVDSVAKLRQLMWVILLSHGYVAYDLNLSYVQGFNRLFEIGFGGMDNNCMGISLVSCCGLGGFVVISKCPLWQKGVAAACVGMMVHAILISMSRGSMLGLIVLAVVSFVMMPKRPVYLLLLAVAVCTTVGVTGNTVMERFVSSFASKGQRDESTESRLHMWEICLEQTARHPVLGLGPHHFPVHATSFGLTPNKEAHTTWLQLAAELGIPGVTFLAAFYLLILVRLWTATRESTWLPDPFLRDVARMAIASTVGFLFTAQFVTLPGLEAPYYIALLGVGVLNIRATADAARAAAPAAVPA